jgi:N-formylglutamate deformylase
MAVDIIMNENSVWRKLKMQPFFVTIPHSGERVPPEAVWLQGLTEPVLMRDVDRYVDLLYVPTLQKLQVPFVLAQCHRYVIDLNRKEDEFDQDSVVGAPWPSGKHPKGLHWSKTTFGETLITKPMTMAVHDFLVKQYYDPFHVQVQNQVQSFAAAEIFHIDAHSMPSQGTAMHNDPGERRADVVVSDFHGKSARKDFVDLIIKSFQEAGLRVAYNWPYFGGGITQRYGQPEQGHHTVQVELNRALYMDEVSKKQSADFVQTRQKIEKALEQIVQGLNQLP